MKRWISITEARQVVSLSRPTLVGLILSGDLRGRKVGKKWLIEQKSIEEYMEGDEGIIAAMVQGVLN